MLLLVRHLLLEAMHLFLIASLFLVAMPGAPSSVLVTTSKAVVTRSDALVPNSFLVPSSDARSPSSVLVTTSKALVTRSDALVPNSFLVPSSDARSP